MVFALFVLLLNSIGKKLQLCIVRAVDFGSLNVSPITSRKIPDAKKVRLQELKQVAKVRVSRSIIEQQIGKVIMESLPKRNLDLTSFSLKHSTKCALKSLKHRGLARLASARRPNNNMSAILFLQIYPWNSDLLPPREV